MVGTYIRKTRRQSWDEEAMQRAIDAINNEEMGWLRASKTFNVPQATLRRRARNKNKVIQGVRKGLGRFHSTFEKELEEEIMCHVKLLESRLFGMTCEDLMKLGYQVAEQNGLPHRFNRDKKIAGRDWLTGFRKRNPGISLRKPEATSAARAMGFNKPQVEKFFKVYEDLISKEGILGSRIYNVDESALSTVHIPQKVFATTGKKQVGALTSAERGMHVTMVVCMNPAGNFVPPSLIFPRKNWKHELIDGAPMGTLGIAHESGWMTGEVFLKWLQHFINYVKASKEDKVLLIVDGHSSHKYVEVLKLAKENGVFLLCLPPHCTHRLQPLDVSFYGPMKTYYYQEVSRWLKTHPGRIVTQYQISELFANAYGKAACVANAKSGFSKTGLWPINPNVIEDYLFAPAQTTDRPMLAENDEITSTPPTSNNVEAHDEDILMVTSHALGSSSVPSNPTPTTSFESCTTRERVKVSVETLSPVPSYVGLPQKRKTTKGPGSSGLLNSSPNIKLLEEREHLKKVAEQRRSSRQARKRIEFVLEDAYNSDPCADGVEDDDDDCVCIYCNDKFSHSKSGESWIRCTKCKMWAHNECAGIAMRAKQFVCDLCTP